MTGWCPYKTGTLEEQECHFDGYCSECPHNKSDLISRQAAQEEIARRDTTDGTVKVYSGREINEILANLPSAQPEPKASDSGSIDSEKPEIKTDRTTDGLISRAAAIDATWEEPTYTDPLNVLTEVRDKIKALPYAQPEQRWIPCSEALPEDGQEVLYSTKTGRVHSGVYYNDGSVNPWYSHIDKCRAWNNVVIAWQPLPEPYKESGADMRLST